LIRIVVILCAVTLLLSDRTIAAHFDLARMTTAFVNSPLVHQLLVYSHFDELHGTDFALVACVCAIYYLAIGYLSDQALGEAGFGYVANGAISMAGGGVTLLALGIYYSGATRNQDMIFEVLLGSSLVHMVCVAVKTVIRNVISAAVLRANALPPPPRMPVPEGDDAPLLTSPQEFRLEDSPGIS